MPSSPNTIPEVQDRDANRVCSSLNFAPTPTLLATVRKETSQLLPRWKKSGKQNHVHRRYEATSLLPLLFTEEGEVRLLNSKSWDPPQFRYFREDYLPEAKFWDRQSF